MKATNTRRREPDNAGNGNQQRKPSTSRPSSPPTAARRASRSPWTSGARPRPALVRLLPRPRARARAVLGRVLAVLHPGQRRPRARDRRAVRFGFARPRASTPVLRWREGDWTAVAGAGAPPCVDLGGLRRPASARHAIDAAPRTHKKGKIRKNARRRARPPLRARCPS